MPTPVPPRTARSSRALGTGRLLLVVTVGTAALATLVVILGTIVVGRLDAATDVNATVVVARSQVDVVDNLASELVLRAREPRSELNSASLLRRRGPVIESEIELLGERAARVGQTNALLGTAERVDRLIDAVRGMVDAGSEALEADDAVRADEARSLVDVFYRLFRHDLAELDEALTQLETQSIREQTAGINTISRWILIAAGVSTFVVLAAGFAARRVSKRERSLMDLLRRRATEDALTGLLNRRGFSDAMERAARHRLHGERLALLFLDLDRFKHINDSLGHQVGDELLKAVAERIVASTRGADEVGRLGGDEFAVLLRWVDGVADPEAAADRLRRAVMEPIDINGQLVSIGVSIGVRRIGPGESDSDALLRDADVAMYDVKRREGGGVQAFDAGLVDAVHLRLERERALREAIASEALDVAYQPVFSADGSLDGVEALVRWTHNGSVVPPDQFLPIAVELGLIVDLDTMVLRRATTEIAALGRRFGTPLRVAVNMAAEEFASADLSGRIAAALEESGLAPDRLIIEITEQGALRCIDTATSTLAAIRALGVSTALDDFGTGHSALSYLERLPIDILKIDRSFLPDDGDFGRGRELFMAVVDLGSRLGFDVVAEGVETDGQLRLATESGCRLLQGYRLGRPGPIGSLTSLVADGSSSASDISTTTTTTTG